MRSGGQQNNQSGFVLVELVVTLTVFAIIALSLIGLFVALVNSELLNKRRAVASTLAVNQMEYLKSLPYNNLAVAGGSIYSSNPLPASTTSTINGTLYTINTSINYVDDAFDGCGNYPNQQLKELYCRNYPPPSGAPALDTNPSDYKVVHVNVLGPNGTHYAEVDTQISARVAETASTTGALFVTVIDANGNPVSGATVAASDTALNPDVNVSDTTDSNGTAVFYGLPPDTADYNYVVTASKTGYSTLTTIAPAGSLQPTYPSQRIFTQLSSLLTLTIKPQGTDSLLVETTNTDGSALPNVKVYAKGGYKKYTDTADTSYYFDNLSPTDSRPTTDGTGQVAFSNLVPGDYIFCGDSGSNNCNVGGTNYYLAAAVPYGGANSFNPITVPTYDLSSPPAVTFPFSGGNYLQKVRLMLTTSSSFPRVRTLTPDTASQASGTLGSFGFQLTGNNLPCSSVASSCSTTVRLLQNSSVFTASCTGDSGGTAINCTVDISGASVGQTQLSVTANGQTLTIPAGSLLGGVNVTP